MNSVGGWNPQDPTLPVSSQDDFQQFLDMTMPNLGDALHFDFDFNQQQSQGAQIMHAENAESMMARMANAGGIGHTGSMQEHIQSLTTTSSQPAILGTTMAHAQGPAESLTDIDAQIRYLQHQRLREQQRQLQEQQRNYYTQNRIIPPTPNSMEMHGANQNQFYSQADSQQPSSVFENYRLQKEQEYQMAFTPLVSPAVTPLETHFPVPEYTVPGAYFSPLSSPALHAQGEHSSSFDPRHSGTTNSPIDLNADSHSAPASSIIPSRKTANRKPGPKPRANARVRQSPIVKPRRGKKSLSTSISAQALGDILEPSNSQTSQARELASSNSAPSTDQSENGSISPEHLSDMAPPPLPTPKPATRSPYIAGQKENAARNRIPLGSPATPASLMRLTQSPNGSQEMMGQAMDLDDPSMENFALPESATSTSTSSSHRPSLSRIDTQSDGQMTPTLSATGSKTGFQALPSPAFTRPGAAASASQSPQIDAMNGTNGIGRKTPMIAARGSKKRVSTSILVSPALLPKISPSIKPLLPGGGVSSEDAAASLLLASKSNYQNILEGTHLPGVSYPSELSTNLTSKRTSHKIAEQGRRNRINSALHEIATLLPRKQNKDCSGEKSGSGDGGENESATAKGGQSANSKASTVEQAIDYIKQLQNDLAAATKRAEAAEKQLEEKAS
ncbi:phosphorus acquisition-controlling protein [Rutstroemia sp. NJR-2017a BBW]|nr:phosphorus acquisition-controlling protein [Rutstroemia sp. NJR-2017a BBW]